MKLRLIAFLAGVAVLSVLCSCATAPKPLASGELRLLSIQIPEKDNIQIDTPFLVKIDFEADGQPEIRSACFYISGDGPRCSKVTDVIYGSPGTIKMQARTNDSNATLLDCFVRYILNGKIETTDMISTHFKVAPVKGSSPVKGVPGMR